jgi:hypothetical protein
LRALDSFSFLTSVQYLNQAGEAAYSMGGGSL